MSKTSVQTPPMHGCLSPYRCQTREGCACKNDKTLGGWCFHVLRCIDDILWRMHYVCCSSVERPLEAAFYICRQTFAFYIENTLCDLLLCELLG